MATSGSETLQLLVELRENASRNLKTLNTAINDLGLKASKTGSFIDRLRGNINGLSSHVFSLKSAIAGLGVGLLSKSFVDAAATSENYRVRLVRLLGSVSEGNKLFDDMSKYASKVAFEFEDIMGAATNLSGVVKGGVEEINQWMPLIGDLAAASGLSIQDTTSQFIRMYSAGAASADMFRERGVLAMLGFQAGVSYSADETRAKLLEAFNDPASKFRDAALDLGTTWDGMLSMISDAWFAFRNMVMGSGLFDYLKGAVQLLLENINALRESGDLEIWAQKVSNVVIKAFDLIIKGAALVGDSYRGWLMIWDVLKIAFGSMSALINRGLSLLSQAAAAVFDKLSVYMERISGTLANVPLIGSQIAAGFQAVSKSLSNAASLQREMSESTQQGVTFWNQIVDAADIHLAQLSSEESYYSKSVTLLGQIKEKAQALADARKEAEASESTGPRPEIQQSASATAQLKSNLDRINATVELSLKTLDNYYANNYIAAESYFNQKEALLVRELDAQRNYYQTLADMEPNLDKKTEYLTKIFTLEQQHQGNLLALNQERLDAERAIEQQRVDLQVAMSQIRANAADDGVGGMAEQFQLQRDQLEQQHVQELESLRQLNADKEQIEEAHRLHEIERDKLAADQRMAIQQAILSNLSTSLGYMQEYFTTAYQNSGNKAKEFFYVAKAISVAQTLMSTYEAAQKAYSSLSGIPYVGPVLGAAAAAAAIAAGIARVAQIRNQQALARGGEVAGYSPTPTADNISISATAGEFVEPVSAVQFYGKSVMEGIRTRSIPRELFSGVQLPSVSAHFNSSRLNFATGGPVKTQDGSNQGGEQRTNIVNILDPAVFDQWSASTPGQRNIMNVLSTNQFELKQMVFGSEG